VKQAAAARLNVATAALSEKQASERLLTESRAIETPDFSRAPTQAFDIFLSHSSLDATLVLGIYAILTWLGGRVYRVGILMYGKRPTFPELVRWAREG
jgi:hypothetical protein